MQIYLGSAVRERLQPLRTHVPGDRAGRRARSAPAPRASRSSRCATTQGAMVPLGSMLQVKQSRGPDQLMHYNAYPAADINGGPAPGVSSGAAVAAMERLARETLPNGIDFEWTDLTYQQQLAGNTTGLVFLLCVLLVFLVLAAQYESWSLPAAVILIVPMSLLCAAAGIWLTDGDNNVFTQIGFLVLVGLACKNAILIVEFARELEQQGIARRCRRRSRPPHPPAAHPDDVVRLHHGRHPAGDLDRRRRRDPARHGRRGVRGHAGRDLLRPGADAGVLRAGPRRGVTEMALRGRRRRRRGSRWGRSGTRRETWRRRSVSDPASSP